MAENTQTPVAETTAPQTNTPEQTTAPKFTRTEPAKETPTIAKKHKIHNYIVPAHCFKAFIKTKYGHVVAIEIPNLVVNDKPVSIWVDKKFCHLEEGTQSASVGISEFDTTGKEKQYGYTLGADKVGGNYSGAQVLKWFSTVFEPKKWDNNAFNECFGISTKE